jgi:hypothetical protein
LGVFAGILAGLRGKKTGPAPENAGLVLKEKPIPGAGGRKNKPRLQIPGLGELKKTRQEEASGPAKKTKPPKGEAAGRETLLAVQVSGQNQIQNPAAAAADAVPEGFSPDPVSRDPLSQGPASQDPALQSPGKKPAPRGFSDHPVSLGNQEIPAAPVREEGRRASGPEGKESEAGEGREGARKSGRRRDRLRLELRDLRHGDSVDPAPRDGAAAPSGAEREIVVDLRSSRERPGNFSGHAERAAGEERFDQILSRELNGGLQADIIKQAAIVLRDGGEGTIKLSLQPQTLGKVKIHLEMAENKVSGHIFVETEEALRVFEREIRSLEQGFRDSGFGEVSFSTALDYRNNGKQWRNAEPGPFYSRRFTASGYDTGSGLGTAEASGGFGFSAVNMLV